MPFICKDCTEEFHETCEAKIKGKTWCDCQHRTKENEK